MPAYPKNMYRPTVSASQHGHFEHVRVSDPAEEEALGEGYFDSLAEMREATEGDEPAGAEAAPAEAKPEEPKAKKPTRAKKPAEPKE